MRERERRKGQRESYRQAVWKWNMKVVVVVGGVQGAGKKEREEIKKAD